MEVNRGGVITVGTPIATPSATVTRPADTNAYDSGDLVANSTTAGSVTPLSFTAGRVAGGAFMARRIRISKTDADVSNAAFRLHLYTASPTCANGDNGAWSTTLSGYLGAFDVASMVAFSNGAAGQGVPVTGSEISADLSSGKTLYGLLEARGAYTPASAEIFTVTLELWQA